MLTLLLSLGAASLGAPTLPLTSFEHGLDGITVSSAETRQVTDHATEGTDALEVAFAASDGYPSVALASGIAYERSDWTGYGALVFDVYYAGEEKLTLNVRLDNAADGSGVSCQTGVVVPCRRQATVSLALPRKLPLMHAGPPAYVGDVNGVFRSSDLDLGSIVKLQFFLDRPAKPATVVVDNLRLAPEVPLEGLVDRYGQYTGGEWPGKTHEDADLRVDLDREREWLAAAPVPASFDEYGGWADGPQLEATGWFRTEKVDGKWWLVTPTGHLFWSVGLDCTNTQNGGPITGRLGLFTWLPEAGDPLARFGTRETSEANFYEMNCARKYGADFWEPWLGHTRERLRAWGVNTVAAWSDQTFTALRMPYAATLGSGDAPRLQGAWNTVPDFFDPAWPAATRERIAQGIGARSADPLCMGYFVDNEIAWGYYWDGRRSYSVVLSALALGEDSAAKGAFTEALRAKHGDIAALNAAWGSDYASWEAFRAAKVEAPDPLTPAVREDLSALLSLMAERYFGTVNACVRDLAPHQLYLGQRFGGIAPAEVVAAAERYCDVVSYNIYGDADSLTAHARHVMDTPKPGLIGEFHFAAMDRGMFAPDVDDQAARAAKYDAYIRRALALDWCVGAHWFTYADQPLVGRFDGENANIGFVSQTDQPYYELIEAARAIDNRVYELRGGR